MSQRIIVTAALPYANGSIHIGHLVEYTQADIYVRALKRLGEDALFICANDAHGTPIELNAAKQGITPEELVARFHAEHKRDFARFDVDFDNFTTTHSDANRAIVMQVYETLQRAGHIEARDVDGNWCEHDQRFLPDRFVKGKCPKCQAEDQYGDVCEACGHTYSPTELGEPYCVLCHNPPVRKSSKHIFFKLSGKNHVGFLEKWIDSGALQTDVANYVRKWIESGLRDWDISRDGPYFGFPIPNEKDKFFYVWLDAPFGYAASSVEWGERHGVSFDDMWRSENTRIEHIIGKDIVYFHTLFWPAVLNAVGYTLPVRVRVHGMLTVNGEKMSKSRGTFINAAAFADNIEPQALRYYYACKLSSSSDDLDLSLDDFVTRVNAELVNKHANLFSRASQFLSQKIDNKLGDLPFTPEQAQGDNPNDGSLLDLACRVVACCRKAEEHYRNLDFGQVLRELSVVADIGNEFMQAEQPWAKLKDDVEAARLTCTFALNVCHALATYLWPIVPRFAEAGARVLAADITRMDVATLFALRNRPIGTFERLFDRIDKKATDKLLEVSKDSLGGNKRPDEGARTTRVEGPHTTRVEDTAAPGQVTFEEVRKVDLRVGIVVEAERVPKSKKLLRLLVDIGEPEARQIVAGIALHYEPEQIVGKRVVVVANLKPAKLMGVESRGMVLAASSDTDLGVVTVEKDFPPGTVVS